MSWFCFLTQVHILDVYAIRGYLNCIEVDFHWVNFTLMVKKQPGVNILIVYYQLVMCSLWQGTLPGCPFAQRINAIFIFCHDVAQ